MCACSRGSRATNNRATPAPSIDLCICRIARSRVSIDGTIASRCRARARASQQSSQIDLATIAQTRLYFSMTCRGNSRVIILRLLVPWTGCLPY